MYSVDITKQFKKDLKKISKQGKNIDLLQIAIDILEQKGTLPRQYKEHPLRGNYKGFQECHIQPDWLLIWRKSNKLITLVRTGSHADLF